MTYFSATLYMNKLYQQSSTKIATAGLGDFASSAWDTITKYVGGLWDGTMPIGSVIGFFAPALLATMGFPWIAIAVEVAGALGVNWAGFWESAKDIASDFIKGVIGKGGVKLTENEVLPQLSTKIGQAFDANTSDKVDEPALAAIADKIGVIPMPPVTGVRSINQLIKEAGLIGSALKSRGILSFIFKKMIPWVFTRALVALGFAVAGGAVKAVVDEIIPSKAKGEAEVSKERDLIHNEKTAPLSADMIEFNDNDVGHVWLEPGNIGNIKSYLSNWIIQVYPQFKDSIGDIESSAKFIETENLFRARNKMAGGLQIFSIPKPFERKIDIVSYIVSGYLKTEGTNAPAQK